jgi:hypothetical protein
VVIWGAVPTKMLAAGEVVLPLALDTRTVYGAESAAAATGIW